MSTVETVLALHREERNGDVLAFLTGQEEVETTIAQLRWVGVAFSIHCLEIMGVLWLPFISSFAEPHPQNYCPFVVHCREHAGRSSKGMQLSGVPLYGGLPYTEQVTTFVQKRTLDLHTMSNIYV